MIEKGENQNIEFKESWRDEYLKWICAFANSSSRKISFPGKLSRKILQEVWFNLAGIEWA